MLLKSNLQLIILSANVIYKMDQEDYLVDIKRRSIHKVY